MGPRKLDGLLRDWASRIIRELESSNLPKETTIYKVMQNGCRVDSGIIPIPNYWPRPILVKFNDLVFSLKMKHRNVLVARYILDCNTYEKIASSCKISKSSAWKYENEYRDILQKAIYCW